MDSAVRRMHAWWHVCADYDNDVMHVKEREREKANNTNTSIALNQRGNLVAPCKLSIIQWAYFQHLNTLNISPYRRPSPPSWWVKVKTSNASESQIGPRTNCYCWPSLYWRGEVLLRGNLAAGLPVGRSGRHGKKYASVLMHHSLRCVALLRIARSDGMPCNHSVGSRLQTIKEPSRLQVCPLLTLVFITSAKEVMFSPGFVCLFVC